MPPLTPRKAVDLHAPHLSIRSNLSPILLFSQESPAKLLKKEAVIPGKRSATRNPVLLCAGFEPFWIPAFAGMTEEITFAGGPPQKGFSHAEP
jgi:hypothetical protein